MAGGGRGAEKRFGVGDMGGAGTGGGGVHMGEAVEWRVTGLQGLLGEAREGEK